MEMTEYIEREAAMLTPVLPKEHRHYQTSNLDDVYAQGWADALDNLKNAPAADVVAVVRCNECSNFRQNGYGVCWCNEYGGAITPEDYCSRAVRHSNICETNKKIPWEAD